MTHNTNTTAASCKAVLKGSKIDRVSGVLKQLQVETFTLDVANLLATNLWNKLFPT